MDVSFVIPCYKSTSALTDLVTDLVGVCRESGLSCDVTLVLDSRDPETYSISETLNSQFSEVNRVILSRNFGQQGATAAGIMSSTGDIVVTLDDDYQHLPSDALALAQKLLDNPDIDLVYGVPRERTQPRLRSMGSSLFRSLMKMLGLASFENFGPLRAFRGIFRESLGNSLEPGLAIDVALSWVVNTVDSVDCDFQWREQGQSGYSPVARLKLAVSYFVTHTTAPLQFGIYLGFFGVFITVIFASIILVQYLIGAIEVPGFVSTLLTVLFIGSIQLLLLGILGKYVGQQHRRGLGQPLFFILKKD